MGLSKSETSMMSSQVVKSCVAGDYCDVWIYEVRHDLLWQNTTNSVVRHDLEDVIYEVLSYFFKVHKSMYNSYFSLFFNLFLLFIFLKSLKFIHS